MGHRLPSKEIQWRTLLPFDRQANFCEEGDNLYASNNLLPDMPHRSHFEFTWIRLQLRISVCSYQQYEKFKPRTCLEKLIVLGTHFSLDVAISFFRMELIVVMADGALSIFDDSGWNVLVKYCPFLFLVRDTILDISFN